ncbi:hypothetical protein BS50DRAFT_575500 [Corynespora cassiicola Philippines]|uniref:VOC domain-containing protein n=1 Tax=Corynespora cassiicola Philippines TaxID=1448308 RepID=A0A2T2NJ92_CORCC|nr:hypothetical protein BS50DRAFT_575500 [Corynespora cassiicola Philippines]
MSDANPNAPPGPHTPGVHIVPPPRPPSPATSSYRLNHLMLRIKDPQSSIRFYTDCFGLHVIFIFNAGPWTIYYLGPRECGMQDLGTAKGLIELYHIPADRETRYFSGNEYESSVQGSRSGPGGVGFGHLGFTVPNVEETLQRVRNFGYEIIKPLNEDAVNTMGLPNGIVEGNHGEVHEGYKWVFRQLAFVKDPDVSVE